MAEKFDSKRFPTVSTQMEFTEPDILDLDLDIRYSVSKLDPKSEFNPNLNQIRNPKKNPNNIYYMLFIII